MTWADFLLVTGLAVFSFLVTCLMLKFYGRNPF